MSVIIGVVVIGLAIIGFAGVGVSVIEGQYRPPGE